MDALQTTLGFAEHQRTRVGALYWEAFGRKLGPAFADDATGLALVQATLSPDRVLVARLGDVIAGVCGFYEGDRGAVDLTWAALRRQLSTRASIRAGLLLAVLARGEHPGALVLDGICVDADLRGHGIGSALLVAASEQARRRGARAVRLSVVDTNPRARALYQRLGFQPVDAGSLGPLSAVYGFGRYTVMEREVDQ